MICINCGREQGGGKFCEKCGVAFPMDIRERDEVPGDGPEEVLPTSWICPQCGAATPEAFCPDCGIKVRPAAGNENPKLRGAEEYGICPSCKIRSDRSVCPQCGIRLTMGSI